MYGKNKQNMHQLDISSTQQIWMWPMLSLLKYRRRKVLYIIQVGTVQDLTPMDSMSQKCRQVMVSQWPGTAQETNGMSCLLRNGSARHFHVASKNSRSWVGSYNLLVLANQERNGSLRIPVYTWLNAAIPRVAVRQSTPEWLKKIRDQVL